MPCLSEGFDKRAHASFGESDGGYFFLGGYLKKLNDNDPHWKVDRSKSFNFFELLDELNDNDTHWKSGYYWKVVCAEMH